MTMIDWLNRLLNRNKVVVVQAPAPAPAPVVTEAPRVITGTIVDTTGWTPETSGWSWSGTRIDYSQAGHSTLVSPRMPIPAEGVATYAVTMACDEYGFRKAQGYIVMMGYTATGGQISLGNSPRVSRGTASVKATFPPEVVEYTAALVAIPQYSGGTNDTTLLKVRFVNLTMDLAA